jgi:hypothetical protein
MLMWFRAPLLASLVLVLFAGCGESHDATEDGGGITFDATPPPEGGYPDTGFDSGIAMSDVGQPCTSPDDCDGGLCISEAEGFPGGYCAVDCTADGMCPDGTVCTLVGSDFSLCLDQCDPAATERECRMGYGCASDFSAPNVCIPGCQDDTDCATGRVCDPDAGFSGEGLCYDPDAMIGDACTDSEECPPGMSCNSEGFFGWPGGACVERGCDIETNTGCDTAGAACIPGGRGNRCALGCTDDSDCRDGYACRDVPGYPGRLYCAPACAGDTDCTGGRVCNPALGLCDAAFTASELGTACSSTMGACAGGTCLTEFDSGFPGSYCVYVGCDPEAGTGCPTGGVCVEGAGGLGVCLEACEDTPDCPRDGYDCLRTDRADPTSPLACMPACTTDASCANMGFACNDGTGLCRPAFTSADLGDACVDEDSCEGGRCLSEAETGWPGGTCTLPGCRLPSSTGPGEPCPIGSACVDDGTGDPGLGVCALSCVIASSTCRDGYTCAPYGGSTTDGTCAPACDADADCTDGGTCNTGTGLCE